jgi:hypothetical protein
MLPFLPYYDAPAAARFEHSSVKQFHFTPNGLELVSFRAKDPLKEVSLTRVRSQRPEQIAMMFHDRAKVADGHRDDPVLELT